MGRKQQYLDSDQMIPGDSFTVGWHGEAVLVTRAGAQWALQRGSIREGGPAFVDAERWDTAVARITSWLDAHQPQ